MDSSSLSHSTDPSSTDLSAPVNDKDASKALFKFLGASSTGKITAEISDAWVNEPKEIRQQYKAQSTLQHMAAIQAIPEYSFKTSAGISAPIDDGAEEARREDVSKN
ncbi:hypothetical protein EDD11_000913 [Mortierella claussenii]|nr:hypothetical protein EDD11_000913 [Mortierella claussenii]